MMIKCNVCMHIFVINIDLQFTMYSSYRYQERYMKLFSFLSRSMPTEKVPTLSKLAYDRAKAIMASNKEKKIDTVIRLLKVNTRITKIVEHDGKSSSVTVDNDRITRFN